HTYGPIFKFYVGSKLLVVVNSPELAKEVLHDEEDTFANRDQSTAAAVMCHKGQNLIYAEDNVRLNLLKTFTHEILSNKSINTYSSLRRDELRKAMNNVYDKTGTNVNVSEITYLIVANIMERMAWGNTVYKAGESGVSLGAECQSVVSRMCKALVQPNLSDYFPILAWYDLQGVERNMKKELKKLDQIFSRIIEDRIKSNSENGVRDEGKKDFLQILLDLKDQQDLNITQVKSLITDLMIAGIETTTTVIEWAMANIMKNHKVMKRVQEELAEIVGLNNMVEESHLPKLQYLDATIKETHRLTPAAAIIIPRVPSKDCEIGGYTIPKGCITFLNILSIHRNPQYWDNPMEFSPERFMSNEVTNKWDYTGKNFKFFPFGLGRGSCPGIALANKLQTYILASLLHSFDWSLPKGEDLDMSDTFGFALKKTKPTVAIPYQRLPDSSLYM
ncbi:cytochrome P450 76C1-like, partial [Bidens hawaiensis]|uniref:cytochrome P450 76C1-like n=1 Tax=Bidens hawaiensis TaxID=980011 RepID=UPI00404A4351